MLSIEPLARAIQANPDIHGLTISQKEFKLSLFADDLVLYLTDPVSSLTSVNSEFIYLLLNL